MDFIKYIDSFGIKFHFYTNNQPKHQNIFGGIMTFIYVFICVIIFFSFCYEDINRLNPISSISEITDIEPRSINMKNEKIWIPFRIVTDENKYIDHRGILHILPYFVEGKYNDKIGMELNYHLLKYTLCNETTMASKPDNYKIDVPLNELFCIEQDDIPLGGNWNKDFINYIEINLYLCDDGVYFNLSDPKCSKIKKFFENIDSSLSFDFYYPVVQFQPTNLKTPLTIIYRNYFYRLSAYSHKLQKMYIQEHVLSDDINLIKTCHKNTSFWGTRTIYGDDYFLSSSYDPLIKNKLSQIFTMEIYLDYGLVYYTRTYNKIIVILSNVFPLFRIVLYFINVFTKYIKMSFTRRDLAELIFVAQKSFKIKNLKKNFNKNKKIKNLKNISLLDNSENEMNKKIKFLPVINNKLVNIKKYQLNKKNISLISNINNSQINNDNISHNNYNNKLSISLINENIKEKEKEISLINLKKNFLATKESLRLKDSFNNNNNKENKLWKKKYIFPIQYFFLNFFFDKLINPQKFFNLSKNYIIVHNFMCQIYDISTHILLFKQFNILNNFLLNIINKEKGYCISHSFKKININDNILIEKLNKDLKSKKSILFSNVFT